MKSISVRDAKNSLSDCLRQSQTENIVIMKHGHPVAVLVGVAGMGPEEIYWGMNEDLMKQILRSRANDKRVPHSEVLRRYRKPKRKPGRAA